MKLKTLRKEELEDKICIVIGTRPSLIKQSPVIRELQKQSIPFFIIHSGQHYSYEMDRIFFNDLELPKPDYYLATPKECTLHGEQTAEMLKGIEQILLHERPKVVLVGGDANTNLAGALAARKLNICVCHDEAGLRSYDWRMPEEHNRVMIDHISEILLAPNERAKNILQSEKVRGKIFITGSTAVDAVKQNLYLAHKRSSILNHLKVESEEYIVVTVHHEENVDYVESLTRIVEGIKLIAKELKKPIIFPIHPRTRRRLVEFGLDKIVSEINLLKIISPLGYLDFLMLISKAALIITDSGGLIQESAILHIPCITLGYVTEWEETLEVGANVVSKNDPHKMLSDALKMIKKERNWPNVFGNPGPARKIVNILKNEALK